MLTLVVPAGVVAVVEDEVDTNGGRVTGAAGGDALALLRENRPPNHPPLLPLPPPAAAPLFPVFTPLLGLRALGGVGKAAGASAETRRGVAPVKSRYRFEPLPVKDMEDIRPLVSDPAQRVTARHLDATCAKPSKGEERRGRRR